MKIGDTVLIRQEPETSGTIIEINPDSIFENLKGVDVLVHVDEGVQDYWYHESEVIVAPHGESKEQVFLELLKEWRGCRTDIINEFASDFAGEEAKADVVYEQWKQRYVEAE